MAGKKTSAFPFYYSDMLSWGTQKSSTVHTIDDTRSLSLHLLHSLIWTSISSTSVLVYKNTTLLVEGKDYTFDTDEAKVNPTTNSVGTSLIGLAVNDKITIVEYTDTHGSFCPNQ